MTAALAYRADPVLPLRIAVRAATKPVLAAMAASVQDAGHLVLDAARTADADVILSDAPTPREPGAPLLILGDASDDATSALPRGITAAQLDAGLRAVAAGLLVRLPAAPGFQSAALPRALLTPREVDILTCLSEGLSNKEAARRLGISAHTVKFHLESVFAKLGATSRADAVARGLRGGMIEL